MEVRLFTTTRTGLYVFKLVDPKRTPKIGMVMQTKNDIRLKVVDVIGPVSEPFIVMKPLSKGTELKDTLELFPIKRGGRAKGRGRRR